MENISKAVSKVMDNETAFKVIELAGGIEIRLYWTSKNGTYGWQVLAVWYSKEGFAGSYKTGGCGYCKEGSALWAALRSLQVRPRGAYIDNEMPYNYRKNGNYYRVNKKDTIKLNPAEKYKTTSAKISKELTKGNK